MTEDFVALEAATAFADLNLAPEIQAAIDAQGYTTPTPIQARAIPLVLAGRDLLAQAQTGTGKTAAFALPLLHRLRGYANTSPSPARHPVRALVLAPTRELAIQVHDSIVSYAKNLPLRCSVVYGGADFNPQVAALHAGVEILVATPGRLLDHAGSKALRLNQVQFLVLDEADRILDMGFMPDLRRILALLPAERQTLLFSATFSDNILDLASNFLNHPEKVEVARRNTSAENVSQRLFKVNTEGKIDAILGLMQQFDLAQAIVFARTRVSCERLGRSLQRRGVTVGIIHGDKAQVERITALDGFKKGELTLLVATDVAARGIDIAELPAVFNYELPSNAEDYVHRIGRTGRAGASGMAISLVAADEDKHRVNIERFIQRDLKLEDLPQPPRKESPRRESARSAEIEQPDSPVIATPRREAAVDSMGRVVRRPAREVCALFMAPVAAETE